MNAVSISVDAEDVICEVSYNQLFFLSDWDIRFPLVTECCEFDQLDLGLFKKAVARLIERHEILRTAFVDVAGQIKQKVLDAADCNWQISHVITADSEIEAGEALLNDRPESFDISAPPLFFVKVVERRGKGCEVSFTMHHVITDAYSFGIIIKELSILYAMAARNLEPKLEYRPFQYREFTKWQMEFVDSPDGMMHRQYWANRLGGVSPKIAFAGSAGISPASRHSGLGFHITRVIDGEFYDEMDRFLRRGGLTRAVLLLGALCVLANRLTGSDDVTFFMPVTSRDSKFFDGFDLSGAIGCYSAPLLFRNHIDWEISNIDYLTALQDQFLDDLSFGSYPLRKIADDLHGWNLDHSFLSTMACYNYHNYTHFKGTAYEGSEAERRGEMKIVFPCEFCFGLIVKEYKNCLKLVSLFSTGIFSEERAMEIKDEWFAILKAMVSNPGISIKQLIG
jgi:hypothetical protein